MPLVKRGGGGVSSWNDLTDKPESFAPSAHALDAHTGVTLAELNAKISDKDIASTDAATTSAAGLVELATSAETKTGTDTTRAVTPAGFLAGLRGNLLGTVSQSDGVPTGAIIERGSNANGSYIKFADGTLVCQSVALSKEIAAINTWEMCTYTLPHVLIGRSHVYFNFVANASLGNDFDFRFPQGTTTEAQILILCTNTSRLSVGAYIYYTAIGRWF